MFSSAYTRLQRARFICSLSLSLVLLCFLLFYCNSDAVGKQYVKQGYGV